MADFTPNNNVRSAIRKLAAPFADVSAFDNVVQGVLTNNPFGCTTYHEAGSDHPGVERSRQGYTARVIYTDTNGKLVAAISIRAPTIASFTAVANQIVGDAAIATAFGGTASRDFDGEKYAATLRCHDANGEIYFVNFSREQVALTSYSDEGIRSKVETWADTVTALS